MNDAVLPSIATVLQDFQRLRAGVVSGVAFTSSALFNSLMTEPLRRLYASKLIVTMQPYPLRVKMTVLPP